MVIPYDGIKPVLNSNLTHNKNSQKRSLAEKAMKTENVAQHQTIRSFESKLVDKFL